MDSDALAKTRSLYAGIPSLVGFHSKFRLFFATCLFLLAVPYMGVISSFQPRVKNFITQYAAWIRS